MTHDSAVLLVGCIGEVEGDLSSDSPEPTPQNESIDSTSQSLAGSYTITCVDPEYAPFLDRLCADCREKDGDWHWTCLYHAYSCNTITNCDGRLVCRSRC